MGWGTYDLNTVMTWGSGFFDTWSNPANQPSGTSHWVGVQTYHYTNAYNSGYGWQLAGGPISNLRFRNSWPSNSGWTTVAMHDRNNGSAGALYAGRYYDADNTAYYCDPNSSSRLNEILLDQGYNYGWWRNYGSTGLYNQSYGRGIWAAEAGGNSYGCYTTYDGGRNGWAGWGIGSRYVFMSTNGDNVGVHDNSRGWVWYMSGAVLYLYYAAAERMSMQSYGVYVNQQVRSAIYYDHNTSYYGDFDSTSRMYRINANYLYSYDWVLAQGDVIAYYSDERLKTKVGSIENALDKISKLNGFYYVENDLAKSFGYKNEKRQLGLSAQEVQEVLPEIVTLAPFDMDTDDNGNILGSKSGEDYLTVNYAKVVPLLVEGIKEQTEIIKSQQKQIDELKEMIKSLIK